MWKRSDLIPVISANDLQHAPLLIVHTERITQHSLKIYVNDINCSRVATYLRVLSISRTLQSTHLTICERQETNNQYKYETPKEESKVLYGMLVIRMHLYIGWRQKTGQSSAVAFLLHPTVSSLQRTTYMFLQQSESSPNRKDY
jgi:hypothetical protein